LLYAPPFFISLSSIQCEI
jgi:hypothetical protein